jgi:hypothetical protein
MTWQVDLIGEAASISRLQKLAPLVDCAIITGATGLPSLIGAQFDALATPEDMWKQAGDVLTRLHFGALLSNPTHQQVTLGNTRVTRVRPDGSRDTSVHFQFKLIVTGPVAARTEERDRHIMADPKLFAVAQALAAGPTWHTLRNSFELLTALIGNSRNDHAVFWRLKYASEVEIKSFLANAQDPRLSGPDAVHSVPYGPLPTSVPMSLSEGVALIAKLVDTYTDRACAR